MDASQILHNLPADLVKSIIFEFNELHKNYFLSKWGPSQLNGGRFGEAVLRILEHKNSSTGQFTPIGTAVPRKQITNQVMQNRQLPDSLRLYIPSLTELLMDFRNNRNVAHLGLIEVNMMDSSFVINSANWIMSELVRIEGQTTPDEAQAIIIRLLERKIPLIEEYGDRLKILDPKLTAKHQILTFCFYKYPIRIEENILFSWVGEKNKTRFKKYLLDLDNQKLIDFSKDGCTLTRVGLKWVEKNINFTI